MRIISGQHKGRIIHVPKHINTRPTTSFAKEGLFNILSQQYHFSTLSLSILDLFAGIGSIGFEFSSRGAKADMVELDKTNYTHLLKTKQTLNLDANIFRSDAIKFLTHSPLKYDIIFADPPFAITPELDLFSPLNNWLKQGGLFILEHDKTHKTEHLDYFVKTKRYGKVHFSFFQNTEL